MDERKVRDYLLSSEHPIGRAEARFLAEPGFQRDRWPELWSALRAPAREGEARPAEPTPFGQKYLVGGMLQGTGGRAAAVQTVWIVAADAVPRFVTVYPADRP